MRAMKDSGVEWLGDIPEGWDVQPLWAHFRRTKRTGFPDETLLSAYRDHGVIPKDSRSDNHNVESADLNGYQLVEDGDLVVNKMKAWQGSLSISKIRGIVSPAYYVFSPESSSVSAGYIHNLLRCLPYILSYSLISKGVRVGQWDLQPELFRKTPVLVPPMKEQVEIASYLDQETSQIDALISKKEQLIEKLLERRQALITQIVTKGLDPNVPMKDSGVEWMGQVPQTWKVVKLSSLVDIRPGFSFSSDDFAFAGDLQVVRMSDIFSDEKALFIDSNSVKFPMSAILADGDIVLGMTGDFGAVLWERGSAVLNQRLASLRAQDPEVAKFLIYPLRLVLQITNDSMFSTTIKNLSIFQLRNLPVPLPPKEALTHIREELDREVIQINVLVEKTEKAIELLKERRQALITQVVTGKIDVRGVAGGNS